MRALVVAAVVLAVLAGAGGLRAEPPRTLRVLFVGNSLTETNDLPSVVASLAAAGGRQLEWRTIAVGGYSLDDHWQAGAARAAIAAGGWDVVVLQQGPSALPESQVELRASAIRFADAARAVGARTALLTAWPESYRSYVLPQVIASYRAAAEAAGGTLLPAGAAWQLAWRCVPGLRLYGPDGFHPSALGTYTAALVVYGRLFAAPLVGVSTPAPRRTARLVQWAAARALGRKPALPRCGG
jgi:hypothetical protein